MAFRSVGRNDRIGCGLFAIDGHRHSSIPSTAAPIFLVVVVDPEGSASISPSRSCRLERAGFVFFPLCVTRFDRIVEPVLFVDWLGRSITLNVRAIPRLPDLVKLEFP